MNKAVLIVDDEVHIRVLMEQTLEDLEDEGVELLTATNGMDALTLIRTKKPNLVFLDVMMPKLNGFEVCQAVKEDAAVRDTYIIMLTAKGQEFDQQQGREVGANLYMTKPFDPDEILEKAAEVLAIAL
ncbi:response regulator [Leptolyngbyaceae cyanobacterium CCMR0082]|uniref:Response regulator n=2 Tax=Adonisia turfae TaxID=2950184 RepID=A0A6M0S526_9CYAN|nr:response regulator [Adonisia turfae]MDV3347101.1 response regulator [Leptothoe sp. LEGE 181152]NEZ59499.1 response regulator [Adonisia turfae CCMR0081]NEZ63495.1 response regulator [Adonisia turfae CCMR0082]